jgi:hypothetical protein
VAERVRALGWKQVEIINSDLGSSAGLASVHVKTLVAQEQRMLLTSRKLLQRKLLRQVKLTSVVL